jgi:hypothetical protein
MKQFEEFRRAIRRLPHIVNVVISQRNVMDYLRR